jgi:hypothetical protein
MNSRKHWLFAALVALCAGTDATTETLINHDVLLLAAGFFVLFYTLSCRHGATGPRIT